MNIQQFKDILHNGVWKQNTGVVQLLGMCPLLAVSSTVVNGVSLGLATSFVMAMSGAAVSPIRQLVPNEIRIPVYILIIAVLVTVVQYVMNAYMYGLYVVLGIFIPLIVTNCIVLARVEAFASKNPVLPAALDGFAMGLGLTCVLAVLGGMREIVGKGTLFFRHRLGTRRRCKKLGYPRYPRLPGLSSRRSAAGGVHRIRLPYSRQKLV